MARVAGAEDAWQARLQREQVAIEFSGSEVASSAKIAACIPLEFHWQPRRAGIGFVAQNLFLIMRRLHAPQFVPGEFHRPPKQPA
jgi:hypothetical protein